MVSPALNITVLTFSAESTERVMGLKIFAFHGFWESCSVSQTVVSFFSCFSSSGVVLQFMTALNVLASITSQNKLSPNFLPAIQVVHSVGQFTSMQKNLEALQCSTKSFAWSNYVNVMDRWQQRCFGIQLRASNAVPSPSDPIFNYPHLQIFAVFLAVLTEFSW